MENKEVSKVVLRDAGIQVPGGFRAKSLGEALSHYPQWSDKKVVVKPTFTNFGIGITMVEPHDFRTFEAAVKLGLKFGEDILVEEFIPGEEYRILVIDERVAAVCQRIPAHVVGDGFHTIRQLIKRKNEDPRSYKIPKYHIRTGKTERALLQEQGYTLDTKLPLGVTAHLRTVSNVSAGGDPVDFTDSMHPDWFPIGIRAAKAVGATFCGLDLITPDGRLPPTADNHAIIEVNFNPALWMHRYPARGTPRYVEKATLDALGFDSPTE
jgi:glutamate--cysteine ligase